MDRKRTTRGLSEQSKKLLRRLKDQTDEKNLVEASIKELTRRCVNTNKDMIRMHYQLITEYFMGYDGDLFDDPRFRRLRYNHAIAFLDAYQKLTNHVKQTHSEDITYRNMSVFPLGWMKKDDRIMDQLNIYPKLVPLLNTLFNEQRFGVKSGTIDQMKDLTGKRHAKNRIYCVHRVDRAFYERVSKELECSVPLVKKYMRACGELGILLCLKPIVGKGSNRHSLWVDGYFGKRSSGSGYYRKYQLLQKDGNNGKRKLLSFNLIK